jgi:hypothetical protein
VSDYYYYYYIFQERKTHRPEFYQLPDVKEGKLHILIALPKVFTHPHITARPSTDA